jgi:hypothetical protein
LKHGDESNLGTQQTSYSVRVENIPLEYRSSKKLFELFDEVFPNEVKFAVVTINIDELLVRAFETRDALIEKLENSIATMESKKNEEENFRPSLKLNKKKEIVTNFFFSFFFEVEFVDAIDFLKQKISIENKKILNFQKQAVEVENVIDHYEDSIF